MYQQITVVGNLGADPELKAVNDQQVCTFNMACNRKWTGRDGQREEDTTWFRVSVWGRQADACGRYLNKGRQVLVTGRVSCRAFVGRQGDPMASMEINASTVQFLQGEGEGQRHQAPANGMSPHWQAVGQKAEQIVPKTEAYEDLEDVPF